MRRKIKKCSITLVKQSMRKGKTLYFRKCCSKCTSFLVKENIIKTHAMARTRVIVRKLASFKTLGYTTVTYYYKMGSLTKNEMTELKIANNMYVKVTGIGYESTNLFLRDSVEITHQETVHPKLALRIVALCNNAVLESGQEGGQIFDSALFSRMLKSSSLC